MPSGLMIRRVTIEIIIGITKERGSYPVVQYPALKLIVEKANRVKKI